MISLLQLSAELRASSSGSRLTESLSRLTKRALVVIGMAILIVVVPPEREAFAGVTILNGTECAPFTTVRPDPNAPMVFPYSNHLGVYRTSSDWNFIISCPLPLMSGPSISSGAVTLVSVDGVGSFNSVRLCFGSYYSDAISCGVASSGSGTHWLYPPSSMPSGATAPSVLLSATLTTTNPYVKIRNITAWWTNP